MCQPTLIITNTHMCKYVLRERKNKCQCYVIPKKNNKSKLGIIRAAIIPRHYDLRCNCVSHSRKQSLHNPRATRLFSFHNLQESHKNIIWLQIEPSDPAGGIVYIFCSKKKAGTFTHGPYLKLRRIKGRVFVDPQKLAEIFCKP